MIIFSNAAVFGLNVASLDSSLPMNISTTNIRKVLACYGKKEFVLVTVDKASVHFRIESSSDHVEKGLRQEELIGFVSHMRGRFDEKGTFHICNVRQNRSQRVKSNGKGEILSPSTFDSVDVILAGLEVLCFFKLSTYSIKPVKAVSDTSER